MVQYLEYIKKASTLIEALPYIQSLRGEVILVKFGGSVLEDELVFESALRDIVFLECVGIKPVIVHGGGKAINSRLEALEIETRFIDGMRYTCEKTISVVDQVLHEIVNPRLVDSINKFGGQAATVSGKDIIIAEQLSETLGYVGCVKSVDTAKIQEHLKNLIVPVITPLGSDLAGNIYNINADVSACEIARAIKARKLVFMSDVPGILEDPSDNESLISTIRVDEIPSFKTRGVISGGMVPKIDSAVMALNSGTNKVHMIDARIQHSILLEIFTDEGVGTQIIH